MKKKYLFLVHAIMMHDREDIFYAVRACVAMHNMMVEVRVSEDQEESSSFYEVAEERPQEPVVDRAERKIAEEDAFFVDNAELADLDNDVVDLAFKERMKKVSFKTYRNRIVQRGWKDLYDPTAHVKLQIAVKEELCIKRYGYLRVGDELADFDPLA